MWETANKFESIILIFRVLDLGTAGMVWWVRGNSRVEAFVAAWVDATVRNLMQSTHGDVDSTLDLNLAIQLFQAWPILY